MVQGGTMGQQMDFFFSFSFFSFFSFSSSFTPPNLRGHWKYGARDAILFVKTGEPGARTLKHRIVRPVSLPSLPPVTLWNNVESWT